MLTLTFETYDTDYGVRHSQTTGEPEHLLILARAILATDDTFCLRSANGARCLCKEFGLIA